MVPLRILYLLDQPQLCGGVKVVFQHARLLERAGHSITVAAPGRRPFWAPYRGPYINLNRRHRLIEQDLVVATYWTTLARAQQLQLGPVVHFCQGYEGDYPHLLELRPQIEEVYSNQFPTWVVSPHLARRLQDRFGRQCHLVTPPLDPFFRPVPRQAPREPPRVLLHGIFECDWKGVDTGLAALRLLKERGQDFTLVRISLFPQSEAECRLLKADRFYYNIRPRKVARITRECDLLLFPSLPAEGFGLPVIEAFASGVPVVASDLPSVRFITKGEISLCRLEQPEEMADRAGELLQNHGLWREARETGFRLAAPFSEQSVSKNLLQGVEWASPAHRRSPSVGDRAE